MWRIITNDDKKSIPSNIRGITNIVGGGYYEMTNKFWNDWQKRVGETKEIKGFYIYGGIGSSLVGYLPFRILSAKFTKDVVDLILEETSYSPINGKHHVENRYIKLNRNDIATVRFKKH